MHVENYGKIGIREKFSCTIPWGKSPAAIPNNLLVEGEVRDVFEQEHHSCFLEDNGPYDLDATKGRAISTTSVDADPLAQGRVNSAVEVHFDDKGARTFFRIESRWKNFLTEVKWENGEIQSVREERVLWNGTGEVLDIQVDSSKGTLVYFTYLVPPTKP